MPIYEYLCEKCGHEFEREQRITEDPVKTCPKCRARKVRRLISRTGFVLKGGGWYSDLYSSAKPGAKEGEGAAADAKADAKPEAKPDAKADAKPGSKPSGGKKGGGKKGAKSAA
ncbi:MAG: zinc ribbon domain-containing protein [Deltaproteobacteria bacterium]|nr:zinc ribbon domain-containing protein [Deltaproteobacteria bacterium]